MHLSLNIVMLIVTLIVVVPFAWFIFTEKSDRIKKKKSFQKIANEQNVKMSIVDFWNNTCLGFDETKNTLLYIKKDDTETTVQKIELSDVKKCVINKTSTDFKSGTQHHSEMSRLDLEFTFLCGMSPVLICLYDRDDNFAQNQELIRAEKWLATIEKHKHSKLNTTAA